MPFSESVKLQVKKKAHFQCCLCHTLGVEIHHIVAQAEGGEDTEDNAAPLCPSCHEAYGANPQKRKFVRETRDFWYEICAQRYAGDKELLDRISARVESMASKQDLEEAVNRLLGFNQVAAHALSEDDEEPLERRSELEILETLEELFDKIWYDRHQVLMHRRAEGKTEIDATLLKTAQDAATRVEQTYGAENLGPWTDFQWGMLNGKLSALRWVIGYEWDMLDT